MIIPYFLYGLVIFMYFNIFRDSVNLHIISDAFMLVDCHTPLHIALVQVDQMIMDEGMNDV